MSHVNPPQVIEVNGVRYVAESEVAAREEQNAELRALISDAAWAIEKIPHLSELYKMLAAVNAGPRAQRQP